MSSVTLTGLLLIALPVAFNVAFALLAARFEYPDILRRPTDEVLEKFREGGSSLVLLWWAFALTAVLLAPVVVLLSASVGDADATLLAVATTIGVLAAVVQFLGLIRWPFLVPYLARVVADPDVTPARREAVDVVFQSFNLYLGVAVGEHLGYALTGGVDIPDGRGAHPDDPGSPVARRGRDRDRPSADGLCTGVRGTPGGQRLESRCPADADRLHRLVAVADRDRNRADRLSRDQRHDTATAVTGDQPPTLPFAVRRIRARN